MFSAVGMHRNVFPGTHSGQCCLRILEDATVLYKISKLFYQTCSPVWVAQGNRFRGLAGEQAQRDGAGKQVQGVRGLNHEPSVTIIVLRVFTPRWSWCGATEQHSVPGCTIFDKV